MTDIEYQTTLYPIKARSDWSTNVTESDIGIITYLLYMPIIICHELGTVGHHSLLFLELQMMNLWN